MTEQSWAERPGHFYHPMWNVVPALFGVLLWDSPLGWQRIWQVQAHLMDPLPNPISFLSLSQVWLPSKSFVLPTVPTSPFWRIQNMTGPLSLLFSKPGTLFLHTFACLAYFIQISAQTPHSQRNLASSSYLKQHPSGSQYGLVFLITPTVTSQYIIHLFIYCTTYCLFH